MDEKLCALIRVELWPRAIFRFFDPQEVPTWTRDMPNMGPWAPRDRGTHGPHGTMGPMGPWAPFGPHGTVAPTGLWAPWLHQCDPLELFENQFL